MESTMRQIRIRRPDLIEALSKNRKVHRDKFLEAQTGYRKMAIEELDRMLASARAGDKIKRMITWPEPEDHTSDYDQAIKMLEMCVDNDIIISVEDFQRLVMDEWGWKASWSAVTSNYTK